MEKVRKKYKVLQYKKMELEKLKRKALYMDIGIFVLHGEMQKKDTPDSSNLKVYINLENMQFTYIPVEEILNFDASNVIIRKNINSIKEEWKNIKELSKWYQEELEFHTTDDAIKNLLRKQIRY